MNLRQVFFSTLQVWITTCCLSSNLSAQCSEPVFAGNDTSSCNLTYELVGTPAGGTWSGWCGWSSGPIHIADPTADRTIVSVPRCGPYNLIYTVDTPECSGSDTLLIRFDDPSFPTQIFTNTITLDYAPEDCPTSLTSECTGELIISNEPPARAQWTFLTEWVADKTLISSDVTDFTVCTVPEISYIEEHEIITGLLVRTPDSVNADNYQDVINDLVFNPDNSQSIISCIAPPSPECFIETELDSSIRIVPIEIGGQWTFKLEDGSCTPQTDTTFLTISGREYVFYSEPDTLESTSDSSTFFLREIVADTWLPTTETIELQRIWEPQWDYDTLVTYYMRTEFDENCLRCTDAVYDFGQITPPPIPEYTCSPTSLVFINTTSQAVSLQTCPEGEINFEGEMYAVGEYEVSRTDEFGCTRITSLIVTEYEVESETSIVEICFGETYDFNNQDLTETGTYVMTSMNAAGCEFKTTLELTVAENADVSLTAMICGGDTYDFDNQELTETGTYVMTSMNAVGCEFETTLELTVAENTDQNLHETICIGESYNFDNQLLSESGAYTMTSINDTGCESITTLNLLVATTSNQDSMAMICLGESFSFNNEEFTEAGTYVATSTNAAGCEITTTLELQIVESVDRAETVMICTGEFYDFDNQQLSEAGTYVATSTNAAGCEITTTLELQVVESVDRAETVMICTGEFYDFDNRQLSEAGTYVATSTNAAGCEITTTLELQVVENVD
ncbi:MAG: hypothetical protein AB8G22_02645, partial [Saprospiraceae bacterium]